MYFLGLEKSYSISSTGSIKRTPLGKICLEYFDINGDKIGISLNLAQRIFQEQRQKLLLSIDDSVAKDFDKLNDMLYYSYYSQTLNKSVMINRINPNHKLIPTLDLFAKIFEEVLKGKDFYFYTMPTDIYEYLRPYCINVLKGKNLQTSVRKDMILNDLEKYQLILKNGITITPSHKMRMIYNF